MRRSTQEASVDPSKGSPGPLARIRLAEVWVLAAVLLPTAVAGASPLASVDLSYHLRIGELILREGAIPRTDPLTFTAAGMPWVDQQWGAQLVLWGAWRGGGWLGLAALRAVLAGATLALVFVACRAAGVRARAAALLTLGAGAAMLGGLQLRPQLFGLVLFAATLALVEGRHDRGRRLWWAVPLAAAWANLHGSFVLAPVVVGLAWLEDVVARRPEHRRTLAVAAAVGLATLANPFGVGVWTYALDLVRTPVIAETVVEWQRPTLGTYSGVLFFLWVAGVAVVVLRRGRRLGWPVLVRLGVFLAIGLSALRGVFWWALVAPVSIARAWAERREDVQEGLGGRGPGDTREVPALNLAIAATLVAVVLLSLVPFTTRGREDRPADRVLSFAPIGVTEAAARHLDPGDRLFAAQRWGSWFEFALPENPVAVDTRFEVIPDAAWRDFRTVSLALEGWPGVLARWNVPVLALAPEEQAELIRAIRGDPGWRLVHEDDDGVVLVRG